MLVTVTVLSKLRSNEVSGLENEATVLAGNTVYRVLLVRTDRCRSKRLRAGHAALSPKQSELKETGF